MIRGIGTSKGIGIGHALIIDEPQIEAKTEIVSDTAAELRRYENVKKKFIADTQNIIEELKKKLKKNDKTSLVLQNQIYLIEDIEMNQQITGFIENEHLCADAAVDRTCSLYADIFASLDSEVMNQRVADIEDLKHRILSMLSGNVTVDLSNLEPDTIIVAKQLHPSVTAAMDTKHVVGIIAEKGGETSHAAILARALEIPAVLSVKDACSKIADNESVIVDGEYGEVFLKPIEKTVQIYTKKKKEYQKKVKELKKYIDRETVTSDGYKVCLAANIGNEDDAVKGMKSGAEGVGLFRTEFLFMNGVSMPDEEKQFEAYKKAAIVLKGKTLTIRTLDVGGDKNIPYMGLAKETNPFLGYRAIRFCLGRVDVFTTQLRAILRVSINVEEALSVWEDKLEKVFPTKVSKETTSIETKLFNAENVHVCKNKVAKPTVFIPVFPGTNCEYDSTKAFERAGADVIVKVFKNLDAAGIRESVDEFEKAIAQSQIIMFPGGFSAGDEPDGSAKFFATAFRNAKMKEAVEKLLNERDGLALGICNGFQALIKLGLVPNGAITGQNEQSPTLTFNTINRHISKMVYTKVVSNLSPWLAGAELGGVYCNPASHGEGRFVAPKEWLDKLFANGQVATQYCDINGNISMDEEWNVNGSYMAIEGITSPDGRCLGKMAHSERRGDGVAINIYGEQDLRIFESGVAYFK